MKVYSKQEVDETFKCWQDDLSQLNVIKAVPIEVLQKIMQEIEYQAKRFNQRPEISYDTAYSDGLYGALSIIDKYTKEYTNETNN